MTNTYTINFRCPRCDKRLSFEKKRNGVSPMARKLRIYSEHQAECVENHPNPADKYEILMRIENGD
jgi:transcription initiation factor IIE alpha subunit